MLRLLHVADAAGFVIANKVNRATDDTKSFLDLYDVSAEFELDRPLLSVKLLQLATTLVTDFTAPSSIDQTLAESNQDCRALGIPEPHTIHFLAGTQVVHVHQISLPRIQSLNGQRHSSIRNDYISLKLAASQYIGAKFGPLTSDVAVHLQAVGGGFLPSEQQHLRIELLKAIVKIFWCVSPKRTSRALHPD